MKRVLLNTMQLRFQEFDDFIICFKPNGIRMHQLAEGQYGFTEAFAEQIKKPLFKVNQLDTEASGLGVFAKSKQAALILSELSKENSIQYTYFFLTNKPALNELAKTESETSFKPIKKVGNFHLWKAVTRSADLSKVKLDAKNSGLPILGDQNHGGTKWFRLGLHLGELDFLLNEKKYHFEIATPPTFIEPDVSQTKNLFQDSYFNKNQLFLIENDSCYRLIHTEAAELRADIYGKHLWVYDYSDRGLTAEQTRSIQEFAIGHQLSCSIRHMIDRGSGVGGMEDSTLQTKVSSTQWQASESNLQFQLRTNAGFSPGLFLDQKENRKYVTHESAQKKVLNLFSYTSGFSVAAAVGGATTVTTVDVSKKFIEWSKENFKLNNLDPTKYEFFAQDCLLFLKGSKKRNRLWDLIICDPPSFGRSADSVWKIEKNLAELAELIFDCLAPQGQLLFTCNYEKWNRHQLIQEFTKKLPKEKFKIQRMPFLSLDFNETDDNKNLMKGFLLQRKN